MAGLNIGAGLTAGQRDLAAAHEIAAAGEVREGIVALHRQRDTAERVVEVGDAAHVERGVAVDVQPVKQVRHGLACESGAGGQPVAIGIGQGKLGARRAADIAAFIENGDVAHRVARDGDERHLIAVRIEHGEQDDVRLIVVAVGQGGGGLLVRVDADEQKVHEPVLIAVVFPVVIDGVLVKDAAVRADGGRLGGFAAQDAAPVQPDAEHRQAQRERNAHQNEKQQQGS